MDLLDKPNVRQKFAVELEDRKVFVRALKNSELKRLKALAVPLQNEFFIGKALVKESGELQFTQPDDETDAQFSERVGQSLDDADVDAHITSKLIHAATKVITYNAETVAKN